MRTVGRKTAVAVAALAVAAVGVGGLSGCSSDGGTSSSQVTSDPNASNQQDAVFANQTIALNEQLAVLTDVLSVKTEDPTVAAEVEALGRQARERVALAQGWLQIWGRGVSEASDPPGLLSGRQITAITVANGPKLASLVDDAVTQYLAATIAVSDAELSGGVNSDAREFAQQVKDSAASDLAALTAAAS